MKKILIYLCCFGCFQAGGLSTGARAEQTVLFIDSYHKGYPWSDGIEKGIRLVLEEAGAGLKIHRMDTKRNPEPEFIQKAAMNAKKMIDEIRPDVIIAADDNASKYVIAPYYKNTDTPVVFCGINWDAGIYGYPYKNATGMVEVALLDELMEQLRAFSKGDRIGYIAVDNLTAKKEGSYYKKLFSIDLTETYAAAFSEWKRKFIDIQKQADLLIIGNNAGIKGWVDEEAAGFIEAETRVPTGVLYDFLAPYAMIGFVKLPEEQGVWAAKTALKILNGTAPADIPVTRNHEGTLIINTRIAQVLKVELPYQLIELADQIIE